MLRAKALSRDFFDPSLSPTRLRSMGHEANEKRKGSKGNELSIWPPRPVNSGRV